MKLSYPTVLRASTATLGFHDVIFRSKQAVDWEEQHSGGRDSLYGWVFGCNCRAKKILYHSGARNLKSWYSQELSVPTDNIFCIK